MRVGRLAAACVTAGVLYLGASPATAAAAQPRDPDDEATTADGEPEPECSDAADGAGAASLQAANQPLQVGLGRGGGSVEREVRMAWTDLCEVYDRAAFAQGLVLKPGVLESGDASIPRDAIEVVAVDPFDKTVRVVLRFDRKKVDPGRYEGSLVLEGQVGDKVVARGQVAMIVTRQEQIWEPHLLWNPGLIGLLAGVSGLVFGWFRAAALSATDEADVKFLQLPTFGPRNSMAFLIAAGAGVTAWTANYLRVPDFRLSAESALGLFPVVGGAAATLLLTFLRPVVSFRDGVAQPPGASKEAPTDPATPTPADQHDSDEPATRPVEDQADSADPATPAPADPDDSEEPAGSPSVERDDSA